MSSTLSTSTPSTASGSVATTIADEIVTTLVSFIPALAPFSAPIALGFNLVSNVAPALYDEIKTLIAQIQAGGTPTQADLDALQAIIANLQNPDDYFGGPVPVQMQQPQQPQQIPDKIAQAQLSASAAAAPATASQAATPVPAGFIATTVNSSGYHVPVA